MAGMTEDFVPPTRSCSTAAATPRLRAFHWNHLTAGSTGEITTLVVIDATANAVLAVLNRHGGPLDPHTDADVRRGLADNADLLGGRYEVLADTL